MLNPPEPSPDRLSGWTLARAGIVAIAAVLVLIGTTVSSGPSETARSRLATVLALAHHGTWEIGRSSGGPRNPFEKSTVDKAQIGDRLISTKPPVLPLVMTAEYIVLKSLFGLRLDKPEDVDRIVWIMAITFIGIPFILTLVFFDKTLAWYAPDPAARTAGLAGLAFGTQLLGYATHINNHVPGACLLMIMLYFALGLADAKLPPAPWRFAAVGCLGALAITVDFPVGIFVVLACLYLLARFPRQTLAWVVAGAVPPLALHAGIMIAASGSPLPVQMRPGLYLFESSYWRNPRSADALNNPKGTYLFHMTFGRDGLFSLFPITLLGLVAGVLGVVRRHAPHRTLLLLGAMGFAILSAYYATSTHNYGGAAYGFRWYIIAAPVLLLMGAPLLTNRTKKWQWIVVGVLLLVSAYSGWQGFRHPWAIDSEWTVRIFGPSV